MKELKKDSFYIKINVDGINYFESKYSVKLPQYLIDFILQYNGSGVEEWIYTNKTNYVINSFLPLKLDKNSSVEQFLPFIRDKEEGIGRDDLIPFAIDPGGRPFLVSIGSNDERVVYYSTVGMGEETPIRKIANSFEEFINGLQTEEEAFS